jgi:hypothetical protein
VDDLNWLIEHRFKELIRYEFSWLFVFDGGISATVGCIWRLIEDGRIRITSEDDGHQFGLPAPVDGVLSVGQRLGGAIITYVILRAGTLDLELQFDSGHILQFIPDSSGYEAWNVYEPSRQFIAIGGGELAVLRT